MRYFLRSKYSKDFLVPSAYTKIYTIKFIFITNVASLNSRSIFSCLLPELKINKTRSIPVRYILLNIINIIGKSITVLHYKILCSFAIKNLLKIVIKTQCLSSSRETFFPKSTSVSCSDRVTVSFTRCVSGQRDASVETLEATPLSFFHFFDVKVGCLRDYLLHRFRPWRMFPR